MKIGLVRHFKVNHPFPEKKFLSKSEVIEWFAGYDNTTNIAYKKVDLLDINWRRCYSSPLIRAVNTAKHIYQGQILETTALKELDILHRLSDQFKLPFIVWGMTVRLKSFLPNKDMHQFNSSIKNFIESVISNNENVLIVSHWFVMRAMRQELLKRGMSGSNFTSNDYGTLYVYEKATPAAVAKKNQY